MMSLVLNHRRLCRNCNIRAKNSTFEINYDWWKIALMQQLLDWHTPNQNECAECYSNTRESGISNLKIQFHWNQDWYTHKRRCQTFHCAFLLSLYFMYLHHIYLAIHLTEQTQQTYHHLFDNVKWYEAFFLSVHI